MQDPTLAPAIPSRQTRPGGRSARNVAAIFAATLTLLRERGLSGVTFNDVASTAGVSRSTIYRRWPDRTDLVAEAILNSVSVEIATPDLGSLEADLTVVLERIGQYIDSPLGRAVLIAGFELSSRGSLDRDRHAALWRGRLRDFDPMFDRAEHRGELPAGFDRGAAFAMAEGAIYVRMIVHKEPIDSAWIARVLSLWHALATTPPANATKAS